MLWVTYCLPLGRSISFEKVYDLGCVGFLQASVVIQTNMTVDGVAMAQGRLTPAALTTKYTAVKIAQLFKAARVRIVPPQHSVLASPLSFISTS